MLFTIEQHFCFVLLSNNFLLLLNFVTFKMADQSFPVNPLRNQGRRGRPPGRSRGRARSLGRGRDRDDRSPSPVPPPIGRRGRPPRRGSLDRGGDRDWQNEQRQRRAEYMRNYRRDARNRELERERDRERHAERRLDPEVQEQDRERQAEYRRDPAVQERERHYQEGRRSDPAVQEQDRERQAEYRFDPAVQEREREYQRGRRLDPAVQEHDRERQAEYRFDPAVQEQEREYQRERRLDPAVQEQERHYQEGRRLDPAVREHDRLYHQERREDPEYREAERLRNRDWQRLYRNRNMTAEEEYLAKIKEGPTNVCSCCSCLFIITSVTRYTVQDLLAKGLTADFIDECCPPDARLGLRLPDGSILLCTTCNDKVVKRNDLPSLCARTCELPYVPPELKNLTKLEERMVALRLPFMQIRTLSGGERQYGVKGSVINVPISVDSSVRILPRTFDQTYTIQVKLMRRMNMGRPYIFETVRPAVILNALR